MIVLDLQDRRPIYEQITEKFRLLILRGVLPPESKMPSVRQLAMELSINPNTIQRAYMQLEKEGLIYPVKGKGNFIADNEQILKKSREEYFHELRGVVKKGMYLGIEEDAIVYIIKGCFKEVEYDRDQRMQQKI